jgi:hypothetical protein
MALRAAATGIFGDEAEIFGRARVACPWITPARM